MEVFLVTGCFDQLIKIYIIKDNGCHNKDANNICITPSLDSSHVEQRIFGSTK